MADVATDFKESLLAECEAIVREFVRFGRIAEGRARINGDKILVDIVPMVGVKEITVNIGLPEGRDTEIGRADNESLNDLGAALS